MREPFDLTTLIEPLLNWFKDHARVLPWRNEPTPYRVWVSEIMLQQTRVEAVKPYFDRFLKELPDVAALSDCPEEKLLKLWEGLGYYNRVRNMQIAAQTVMENYHGELPADYEALTKLKGIGHYTAGAIASIAFGIPVPAVDGNVLRVISRVTEDDADIMKASVRTAMEKDLLEIMPENRAGAFNQALMELGATVCLPNGAPLCEACPWKEVCRAQKSGRWRELPVKSKAKARRIEDRTVLVIKADYEALTKLKGIGHYTAGAIASIAFGIPVPAVDGNVLRVISRVTEDDADIMKASVRTAMEKDLLEIMPENRAGAFNQALMELGATVCLPNGAPLCEACPWKEVCRAQKSGRWRELPVKSKAKARRIEDRTVLVIKAEDKVLLHKRANKGLLAGLYEFPNVEGHLKEEEVITYLKKMGLSPIRLKKLEDSRHIFSHIEWHMTGYAVQIDETEQEYQNMLFVDVKETEEQYPIPAAFSRYTGYMNIRLGNDRYKEE